MSENRLLNNEETPLRHSTQHNDSREVSRSPPSTDPESISPERGDYGAVQNADDSHLVSEGVTVPVSSHDTSADLIVDGHEVHDFSKTELEEAKTMRSAIFTMLPLFMGYASLITLQDNIKDRMGLHYDGKHHSSGSYEFSFAVSFIYFGNLVFRLMHNVLFSPVKPRYRVCIAYSCMALSTTTLTVAYYFFDSKSIVWTFVAYSLGGVAIGTFESNLISCITPLGHGTKVWAQLGIPIGFSGISIGAFLIFAAFPSVIWLQGAVYLFVAASNLGGMAFFLLAIPNLEFKSTAQSVGLFWNDLKRFREWVPAMIPFALALALDMFSVSFFSSIQLYIYDVNPVPLWWNADARVHINIFRAVYNMCSLLGDASGRKIAYWRKSRTYPLIFIAASIIGGGLILSKIALLAPLGMFFVMFANGSVYATTTKFVDTDVNHRFNLIALSIWLFVGDVGSFIGANVVAPIRVVVGPVPS